MSDKRTPLVEWDSQEPGYEKNVIWRSRLDQRWLIEVRGTNDGKGEFNIFDHENNDAHVHGPISVPLLYGAKFGPDVSDVMQWQEMAINFVDNNE